MSNSTQTLNTNQNQQGQKDQYSNQANTGSKKEESTSKVGNNIEKDEPRAGAVKGEGNFSTSGNKTA